MLLKAVAQRYAGALLSLEQKAGGLDKLEKDLELVAATMREHDGLRHALESPTVASSKKHTVLKGVFEKEVSSTVLHFLYVLVDKKREEYIETILTVFQERLRERRGEVGGRGVRGGLRGRLAAAVLALVLSACAGVAGGFGRRSGGAGAGGDFGAGSGRRGQGRYLAGSRC